MRAYATQSEEKHLLKAYSKQQKEACLVSSLEIGRFRVLFHDPPEGLLNRPDLATDVRRSMHLQRSFHSSFLVLHDGDAAMPPLDFEHGRPSEGVPSLVEN